VAAGLAAGALDILAAFATSAAKPAVVLKAIASGLLGRGAFRGGPGIAALGLGLHFMIALGWAAVYWLASRRVPFFRERPLVAGPAYGVFVYWFMQLVVLPLSAAPKFSPGPRTVGSSAKGMLIHIFCVGLPIALLIARGDRQTRTP
jgi:hypothetical protein